MTAIKPEKEATIQRRVVLWIEKNLPRVIFQHTPARAITSPRARANAYRLGLQSGWPDLILIAPSPTGQPIVLAWEIKRLNPKTYPTPVQRKCLQRLAEAGVHTAVIRSEFDAATAAKKAGIL